MKLKKKKGIPWVFADVRPRGPLCATYVRTWYPAGTQSTLSPQLPSWKRPARYDDGIARWMDGMYDSMAHDVQYLLSNRFPRLCVVPRAIYIVYAYINLYATRVLLLIGQKTREVRQQLVTG